MLLHPQLTATAHVRCASRRMLIIVLLGASLLTGAHAANVYVTSSDEAQGRVTQYRIEVDGTLTSLGDILAGVEPAGLVIDEPGGALAYLLDHKAPMIGQFARHGGVLEPLHPFAADLNRRVGQLVLRRLGETTFAYALDSTSDRVHVLSVDAAGQLRETGLPPIPAGVGECLLALHPRHPFAYVPGDHPLGSRIFEYELDTQSGNMRWIGTRVFFADAADPLALLIHPRLDVAYLASRSDETLTMHRIEAEGNLAKLHDASIALPWLPGALVIAGDGNFLYAAARSGAELAWWRIDPDEGKLIFAGLRPMPEGAQVRAMAAHAELPWLYVLDAHNRRLLQFAIAANGDLVPLSPSAVEVPPGAGAVHITAAP